MMVRTREVKYMVRLENVIRIRARLSEASNLQCNEIKAKLRPASNSFRREDIY